MKKYTFRITQPLKAYYEAKIDVEATSAQAAKNKLQKMSQKKLDKMAYNWEQETDNAEPDGTIEIHNLI